MTTQLESIGGLIHDLRNERGLTQSQLAEKLDTTQSAIARIENGKQNISTEMLARIGKALKHDIIEVSDGALNIQIEGGHKLSGSITTKTSKNAAMGLLAASLLNRGTTTLKNVPKIEEVARIIEVFDSIGVKVRRDGSDIEITPPKKFNLSNIDHTAATKTRSVIMLIGPLIHFLNDFSIPQTGGCKLGSRTVRPHFFALENFGVKINTTESSHDISHNGLSPAEIVLYESGDTVTENALMAAALTPGTTTIKFASANYMVQDLCFFLESLGVEIEGIGTTTLTITGLPEIKKDTEYYLSEDPIESMFFLATAILTHSSIEIKRCPIDFLEIELLKLEKMGFKYSRSKPYKAANGHTNLVDITTRSSKLVALDEKIECRPYPGLNADNLPFFAVIATQAEGQTLIHDWMYEKRAIYYKDLDKLGAETMLADPHRLFITGKTDLKAAEVICPPALRPSAIVLIGMLGAEGVSTLRNIYNINRGYEDIIQRLNAIGANIKVLRSV